ncbi:hypothetical protein [Allokutzneria oryzae]|uniref:Uncharacterized protein n=1 Tax=Allokutzneria oryzae TaxID=1378989 RepID=A0ABV6AAV5_9PSEU
MGVGDKYAEDLSKRWSSPGTKDPKTGAARWDDGQKPPSWPPLEDRAAFDIPPVRREHGGTGDVAVSTAAVKYFAEVMGTLSKDVDEAIRELGKVDVRPGNFYHADRIVQKVSDTSADGLKSVYSGRMQKLKSGLMTLSTRMNELAKRYETTEGVNSAGADEVTRLMKDVGTALGRSGPAAPRT